MRTLFIIVFICLAGIFLCVPVLHAQQIDTTVYHQLKGVEVVEKARPSTTREATPLQVMDRSGIERLGIQDLSEAVKRFSGATVKDYGGIGGLKTVSVRSLGAQHTGVSYDGVAVSDCQSGQVDISRFSLENLDQIELSIIQNDDIFRTARMFASSSSLVIKTRKPEFEGKDIFHIAAKIKTGSFGLFNPYLRYEQKLGKRWSAVIDGDWQRADGQYEFILVNGNIVTREKRKNTDVNIGRVELNLYGGLGRYGDLSLKAYYFDSERGLPGSVNFYNDYTGERLWDRNFFAQGHYENKLNDRFSLQSSLRYNWYYNRYKDVNNKYEGRIQVSSYYQRETYLTGTLLYVPIQNISFSLAQDIYWNDLNNNFKDCQFPSRLSSLTALSAKYEDPRLTSILSLLATYIDERVELGEKPANRKHLSPTASLSWRVLPDANLRVRFSYKDAFRLPTFNDLYYSRIGNTNLKPEKARQYNLGVTWRDRFCLFNSFSITTDAYYNRVKDKIVAIPTMFIWKMMNLGEVDIKGLDVNVHAGITLKDTYELLLDGSYSFQKAIDITNEKDKSYKDQIPYTPRHSGSYSASFLNPWVNISYSLTASGVRYMNRQNIKENEIESYVEQNVSLNRNFRLKRCSLRLQADILNIADKQYDIVRYYPMPGRSFRCAVSITY